MNTELLKNALGTGKYGGRPQLKLTRKEKIELYGSIEEWGKRFALYVKDSSSWNTRYGNFGRSYVDSISNTYENLELIEHGRFNNEKYSLLLNPIRTETSAGETFRPFGLEIDHFDVISSKIQAIVGKEIRRPLQYQIHVDAEEENNTLLQEQLKIGLQYLTDLFANKVNQISGKELFNTNTNTGVAAIPAADGSQIDTPQKVEEQIYHNIKTPLEVTADNIIKYFYYREDLQEKCQKNFLSFLASAKQIYYVNNLHGFTYVRNVDARNFYYEINNSDISIEKSSWFHEVRYLTMADVLDEFTEYLDDDKLSKIQNINSMDNSFYPENYVYPVRNDRYSQNLIEVSHLEWAAWRKLGIVTYYDSELGESLKKIVDEDYELDLSSKEVVEWHWVNEWWQADMIGNNVIVNLKPIDNQFRFYGDLYKSSSSYVGIDLKYSLLDRIKPLQFLFNYQMYKYRLFLTKSKGDVVGINQALIPNSGDWNEEKFFQAIELFSTFMFDKGQLDKEEAITAMGKMFEVADLSQANTLRMIVEGLILINSQIKEITGITDQFLGQNVNNVTATGVERSVNQSSSILESLYYYHDYVKARLYSKIVEVSQKLLENHQLLSYIAGDGSKTIFKIHEKFPECKIEVRAKYSPNEERLMATLDTFAQSAIQNGLIGISDLMAALESNSISKVKEIFVKAEKQRQQQAAQQAEQQQQLLQQQNEMQMQIANMQNETSLQNAQLNAQTQLEIAKLQIELKKLELELKMKEAELNNNVETAKIDLTKTIKDKELEFKEKELAVESSLEKQNIAARNKTKN